MTFFISFKVGLSPSKKVYSSLPNRGDVMTVNFLRIFHPQLCYFSHHVYQKWPKLRTTTLIPSTTFIKIKESSSSASHNSVILATASLKIRQLFRSLHKSVKIILLNRWLHTRKNKSFECGIVINCFESIYCQRYVRLNTGVILIRFNSIE